MIGSKKIMECVPNFSEGRRPEVIKKIVEIISSVDGVKVLHVDSGFDANRTVVTFAGHPDAVSEAAFRAVKCASELIDMRLHTGCHPRIGATDVMPFVPVCGMTLDECADYARSLSRRIYDELKIPVYCYEAAAYKDKWRNLAMCRMGEYESLPTRMVQIDEMPDWGGGEYTTQVARSGASVVGARKYLIAVNFNLNKEASLQCAKNIALDVREKGRLLKCNGVLVADKCGEPVRRSGSLKACKAIGWYIEEYERAQVSMNITDIDVTSLYKAYEEVCRVAEIYGGHITGTEIIGLVPERVLVDAGRYFAEQRNLQCFDNNAAVNIAIDTMKLNELSPFIPNERIIEWVMGVKQIS